LPDDFSCNASFQVIESIDSNGINWIPSEEIERIGMSNSFAVLPTKECSVQVWVVYGCPEECAHLFPLTIHNSAASIPPFLVDY